MPSLRMADVSNDRKWDLTEATSNENGSIHRRYHVGPKLTPKLSFEQITERRNSDGDTGTVGEGNHKCGKELNSRTLVVLQIYRVA